MQNRGQMKESKCAKDILKCANVKRHTLTLKVPNNQRQHFKCQNMKWQDFKSLFQEKNKCKTGPKTMRRNIIQFYFTGFFSVIWHANINLLNSDGFSLTYY